MKDFKKDKNGVYFTKHSNFRIELFPHEKFDNMVTITKGPAFGRELIGKKYINYTKAVLAITQICGDRLTSTMSRDAYEEMVSLGLVSDEEVLA